MFFNTKKKKKKLFGLQAHVTLECTPSANIQHFPFSPFDNTSTVGFRERIWAPLSSFVPFVNKTDEKPWIGH